jgi:hypothetical protein
MLEQMGVDFCNGAIDAQRKLVEEWLGEAQAHAIDLAELLRGVMCLLITELGNLSQSLLAQQENNSCSGDQAGWCRCWVAPRLMLLGGQGEDVER